MVSQAKNQWTRGWTARYWAPVRQKDDEERGDRGAAAAVIEEVGDDLALLREVSALVSWFAWRRGRPAPVCLQVEILDGDRSIR